MQVKELLHYCHIHPKESTRISPHVISYYDLTMVLSGRLVYAVNGTEYTLQKNDLICLPPGTLRERIALNSGVEYVSFNFTLGDRERLPLDLYMQSAVNRDIRTLTNFFGQEHLSPYYHAKEKLVCILNYILYELCDQQDLKSYNPHVTRALQFIRENLNRPLSLRDVSQCLHLSREYTAILFRKELGKTVSECIHEEKMNVAKNLIADNAYGLQEIAERLGYENYGYFLRVFKKHFHTTPSRFKMKYESGFREKVTKE